jgi:hypothetical protein
LKDLGDNDEIGSYGQNRKNSSQVAIGFEDLGIDNPLDTPQGLLVMDDDGNVTHINPHGPNRNWGKIVTGSVMVIAGTYTIGVSEFLMYAGYRDFKKIALDGALHGLKTMGKGGIMMNPGGFMIYEGVRIIKEGWKGD